MGTGIYCFATLPPIREKSTLYTYNVDPSSFFSVLSLDHENLIGEFSQELLRYVVSTLHQLYGDRAVRAPLHAWYEHYNGPEYKEELLSICDRYTALDSMIFYHAFSGHNYQTEVTFYLTLSGITEIT